MQATPLWAAGTAFALAFIAALAERRRAARQGAGRIGWVPWSGLVVLFAFAGVGALLVAVLAR